MTLTKSQITDDIAHQNGFTKIKSTETVETILVIIKSTLASGDDVLISGFGKFCVKEKRDRKALILRIVDIIIIRAPYLIY